MCSFLLLQGGHLAAASCPCFGTAVLSFWQNAWGISVLEEPFLQHPAMGTAIHPPESSLQWALAPMSISSPCRFPVQGDGAGLAAQCWEG